MSTTSESHDPQQSAKADKRDRDPRVWLAVAVGAGLLYIPAFLIDRFDPDFNIPQEVDGTVRTIIIGALIITSLWTIIDRVARNSRARFDRIESELADMRRQMESVTNQIAENGLRIEKGYDDGYADGLAKEPMRPQLHSLNGRDKARSDHQS